MMNFTQKSIDFAILRNCIFALLMFVVCSCSTDKECRTEEKVRCLVAFECDSVVTTEDTIFVVSFSQIDSLTVVGIGVDSVLYDNEKDVTTLSLPLRSDSELTEYSITLCGRKEVLTIRHQNENHFISMACGCFVYHTIDTAFLASGDTVQVLNSAVENYEQNNLTLHLHF